jgi:hypothetical protein
MTQKMQWGGTSPLRRHKVGRLFRVRQRTVLRPGQKWVGHRMPVQVDPHDIVIWLGYDKNVGSFLYNDKILYFDEGSYIGNYSWKYFEEVNPCLS